MSIFRRAIDSVRDQDPVRVIGRVCRVVGLVAEAEASVRREPVNHRVEYWRRCLEIWHFCEILFLGDTTILGEKDHSSSSSSRIILSSLSFCFLCPPCEEREASPYLLLHFFSDSAFLP